MTYRSAGAEAVGVDGVDDLLARSADVAILVDWTTGTNLRRWYDPERSRLRLADERTLRVIELVHPDDIPEVLDTIAQVARTGETRSVMSRFFPDGPDAADGGEEVPLLVGVHDASDVRENALFIQAWVVDFDRLGLRDVDPSVSMSSLGAAAPVGLQVRSATGNVSFENERFRSLAERRDDEIDAQVRAVCDGGEEIVVDLAPTDDDEHWLRLRIVPSVDDGGEVTVVVASLEDVTSLRIAQQAADAAESLFRAVFDGSPMATAIVDLEDRFVQVNESFAVVCGYAPADLVGRCSADITHSGDDEIHRSLRLEVIAGRRGTFQMEQRYRHGSGHEVWVELTAGAIRDPRGEVSHFVLHVEDITARKTVYQGDEAYWAVHDHLTGLPNRRFLDQHFAAGVGPSRRAEDRMVVLFIDLDDFKPVNDRYGHLVGDEVLRVIARRLRAVRGAGDIVARYGGDEFVLVSSGRDAIAGAEAMAARILAAVRAPITGMSIEPILVGASIGGAVAADGDRPEDLVELADAAAYRAKADGKNRVQITRGEDRPHASAGR